MADTRAAFRGFPLGIEISVVLHVVVVAIIWAVLHFHGHGVALPAVNNPFDHAIAVTMVPAPKPQPKPKVIPAPTPPKPVPTPPVVQTQSVQPQQQTPPPDVKTPPAAPQQEPQPEDQASPGYQQLIMSMLQQAKQYPRQAIMNGDEGSVTISFILNAQGTVLSYTIEKPSGHDELDAEVRRLIHVVHFPPFPADYPFPRMTLAVTLDFHLGAGPGR